MNEKKYTYVNLGVMKQSPSVEGEPKRFYIQLEQSKNRATGEPYGDAIFPITLANGLVLNDGDTLALFSKKEKFDKLVADGKMSRESADKLSFLKFDVCAKVRIDEGAPSSKGKKKDSIDF